MANRVSQTVTDVLYGDGNQKAISSQLLAEVLVAYNPNGLLTQTVAEVLLPTTDYLSHPHSGAMVFVCTG